MERRVAPRAKTKIIVFLIKKEQQKFLVKDEKGGKLLLQEPSKVGPTSLIPQRNRGNGGLSAATDLPGLADHGR